MKWLFRISLLVLLMLLLTGCSVFNDAPVTVYCLTKAGAATFRYNETGDLLEAWRGDKLIARFTYDEAGNRLSYENIEDEEVYTYDARGNLLTHRQDNGVVNIYTYDGRNNRLTRQCILPDGQLLVNCRYTYDSQNRCILEEYLGEDGTVLSAGKTIYIHDRNGRVISRENWSVESNTLMSWTRFEYDGSGNCLAERTYHSGNTEPSQIHEWTYNEAGKRITERKNDGSTVFEAHFTYDDAGNLTAYTEIDSWRRSDYIWTYDEAGRKTEQLLDCNGSISRTVWTYDEAGRKLTEHTNPIPDTLFGGSFVYWNYDENGNLSRMKRSNQNAVTYEYIALEVSKAQADTIRAEQAKIWAALAPSLDAVD